MALRVHASPHIPRGRRRVSLGAPTIETHSIIGKRSQRLGHHHNPPLKASHPWAARNEDHKPPLVAGLTRRDRGGP
eukprot:3378418-Rhodomonas_salina.1